MTRLEILQSALSLKTDKKTAVICGSSESFAFAVFVTLSTFFKHSPLLAAQADIFVYGYKYTGKTKELLRSTGPVNIIDYDFPLEVKRTEMINKFTPALFSRFEAFRLLEKYENVICIDSDILVQKELTPLLSLAPGGIAMTKDDAVATLFLAAAFPPEEGFDTKAPCYNAGIISLNNKIKNGREINAWCYRMLQKYAEILYLGDQGIINAALQKFNLKISILSDDWNKPASYSARALKKAYIIHSTGAERKFWSYYYFDEWYETYALWAAGGGTPALRRNTQRYNNFLKKYNLQNKVFFQLAPDFFKYPAKFLRFAVKRLFRIKY